MIVDDGYSKRIVIDCMLNEQAESLLLMLVDLIRENKTTTELATYLYGLGLTKELAQYFLEEALTVVRLKTITPEEVRAIIECYSDFFK